MEKTKLDVSIIIPARNEERNIGACLDAIFEQETPSTFEIILIDSGSTDRTVEIVRKYSGIELITIAPEEFGHGKTRNLGASRAKGDVIVFLNADAVPGDHHWLESLLRHFKEKEGSKIAGVFSRHLPKAGCDLYMARDILESMPDRGYVRHDYKRFDFMIFSTVSCAVSREIWREFPFEDEIDIAEDQDWAKQVLREGFEIIYEPASIVYHSHNFRMKDLYAIKKRIGSTEQKFNNRFWAAMLGLPLIIGGILVKISGDIFFILFKKRAEPAVHGGAKGIRKTFKQIRVSVSVRIAGFCGRYAGWIGDKNE